MKKSSDIYIDSTNIYKNFANEAFHFFNTEYNPNKSFINKLFKINQIPEKTRDNFKFYYSYLSDSLSSINNNSAWFKSVYNFATFIRYAEKCFLYNNSDLNSIYAESEESTKTTVLYVISDKDVKIRISFQDSSISIPTNKNSILGFLNDEDSSNDNVLFIKMKIIREFGKQMTNEFSFIHGSEIPVNDESDSILLVSIKNIVSEKIMECFSNIFNNYILSICNHKDNIKLEDIIK